MATKGAEKFDGVELEPALDRALPLIEGVLGYVDCTVDPVHEAGDHYIVVGRVKELAFGDGRATPRPPRFRCCSSAGPTRSPSRYGGSARLATMRPEARIADGLQPSARLPTLPAAVREPAHPVGRSRWCAPRSATRARPGLLRAAEPGRANPAARATGVQASAMRLELVGAQLIGLAMMRYVLKVEPVASAPVDDLSPLMAPPASGARAPDPVCGSARRRRWPCTATPGAPMDLPCLRTSTRCAGHTR